MTEGAKKFDADKIPVYEGFDRYFPRAKLCLAMVSEYGFRKYGSWGGWKKLLDGIVRYTSAKSRHSIYQEIEGAYDAGDSGLPHAAHEAWNAMAKLEMLLEQGEIDIMRGNDIVDGKPVLGTARKIFDVAKKNS
jgi:hypothetical protein